MQYIVEINADQREFIGLMSQMRTWLDHQRIQPDAFRHATDRAEITIRVDFSVEAAATAFAQAFGGRLIGPLPADPGDPEPAGQHPR